MTTRASLLRSGLLIALAAACRDSTPLADSAPPATAGEETLTLEELAGAFGMAPPPFRVENLRAATELWVDYQLLARAAAQEDTLGDPGIVEAALWGTMADARARKWYGRISPTFVSDSIPARELYERGEILVARQILLPTPPVANAVQAAQVRNGIDSLRRTLTPANFVAAVKRYSADSASIGAGGLLPAWPARRDVMVPEFEAGVLATRLGQISGVIPTTFGAHIIYRPTWPEAEKLAVPVARELQRMAAESTYFAGLERAADVKLADNATLLARAIADRPELYADSTALVIATIKTGNFTAASLVRWLGAFPPSEGVQNQLLYASDTTVPVVLRRIIGSELFLRQADSAGVVLTAEEKTAFGLGLRLQIDAIVGTLGLSRRSIPDSIWTLDVADRRAYFARRIDARFASMVARTGVTVPIPPSLRLQLRRRYPDASINPVAIERAVGQARRVREASAAAYNEAAEQAAKKAAETGGPVARPDR